VLRRCVSAEVWAKSVVHDVLHSYRKWTWIGRGATFSWTMGVLNGALWKGCLDWKYLRMLLGPEVKEQNLKDKKRE